MAGFLLFPDRLYLQDLAFEAFQGFSSLEVIVFQHVSRGGLPILYRTGVEVLVS